MNITLNAKAITDEMMALTALRNITRDNATIPDTPLLTRDHLPGLRVVMRMVFAELMLGLGDIVETCDIDDEDQQPPLPYSDETPMRLSLTLRTPAAAVTAGHALTLKRQLEHMVAAGTLGWVAADADTEFARSLQTTREAAFAALRNSLTALCTPAPAITPWP